MPETLHITPAEFASTQMGRALLAGKLTATVIGSTGHVTVKAVCKAKIDGRWKNVTFDRASHVFLSVPAVDGGFADKIGTYYPQGKYEGMLWSDRNADETRVKAAVYMLNAAGGKNPGTHVEQATHCFRCGKELTEPESQKIGFGPDCAAEVGAYHATPSQHQQKVKGQQGDGTPPVDVVNLAESTTDARRAEVLRDEYARSEQEIERDRETLEAARDAQPIMHLLLPGEKASDKLASL
jgi:Family of unknown function (DUF6011)